MGVMIQSLVGNKDSVDAFKGAIGKKISILELEDNKLIFKFEDGYTLKLFDAGQSCCEDRYMQTDDDLEYYVGADLLDAEIKSAPETEGEYGDVHEIEFLEIKTSLGSFTMANHNEHNGYYGGFYVKATN